MRIFNMTNFKVINQVLGKMTYLTLKMKDHLTTLNLPSMTLNLSCSIQLDLESERG